MTNVRNQKPPLCTISVEAFADIVATKTNLLGKMFGEWLVIAEAENNQKGQNRWLCRCSCGREKLVIAATLRHGRSTKCVFCSRKEKQKKWTKHGLSSKKGMTPERNRDYIRYRFYGLMPDDFSKLLASQNNCCAICNTDITGKKSAHVDHCHETHFVRGLLCVRCNTMLGYAKDSIKTLENAISYLQRSINAQKEE